MAKAREFDLEHRTAYRFAVLSAMSARSVAELYRRHRLTVSGWRTLSLIGHHEPVYPSKVAERSSVERDKVTRAVDRLVRQGLVRRKLDPSDRRRVVLTLTAKGRDVHDEIDHVRRAIERELVGVLSERERRLLGRFLDKLEAQARRLFTDRTAWRAIVARAGKRRA